MKKPLKSLKDAKKDGDLETFIRQHEKEPRGDKEKFDKALDIISHPEKSKSTQGTSSQDSSGS
jgi:hypothetical protein